MPDPLILVTNDDGIRAPGIQALAEALAEVGEVAVFAPESQQSAVGHGVSLHKPLRANRIQANWTAIDGTPTDCVMLAVRSLLGRRPDLVVSGINAGPNLGDDVTYSGTVAGAYEGMLLGIPAIAVSMAAYVPRHYETGGQVARRLAEFVLVHGMPADTAYNVNVPDLPFAELQGIRFTRQGRRTYQDEIIERTDPRGGKYYWIGGAEPSHVDETGTDFEAVAESQVSLTPLHRDLTHLGVLESLQGVTITL